MSTRTELRRRLAELCGLGSGAKEQIDRLERMRETCPAADLAASLGAATTERIQKLEDALQGGRVIKRAYVDRFTGGEPTGCLMYYLFGWTSNEDLWNWEVEDGLFLSASRTMRRWDQDTLSPQVVLASLRAELLRREACEVTCAVLATQCQPTVEAVLAG